jgi:hypothetical protein
VRHKRPKRNTRRTPSRLRLGWVRSLRIWMAVAWIGTFAAIAYGLQQLEPYVSRINEAETVIEWVGAPDWLRDENWKHVQPELETRIKLYSDTDIYDQRVCPYVAERLAGSPWIARVRRVAKQIDGRVKIYCDFRKPFALVEDDRTAYLVDDVGTRLPHQWASKDVNRTGWLVIRSVDGSVPQPGERWVGEDLAAGLSLARFLYRAEEAGRVPFRSSIRAIDVGNFDGKKDPRAGRLRLITTNPRSYIHWGLPPGEEYGIESDAELKLAMLCKLHAAYDRFPDRGPIDVRGPDGIGLGEPQ